MVERGAGSEKKSEEKRKEWEREMGLTRTLYSFFKHGEHEEVHKAH